MYENTNMFYEIAYLWQKQRNLEEISILKMLMIIGAKYSSKHGMTWPHHYSNLVYTGSDTTAQGWIRGEHTF